MGAGAGESFHEALGDSLLRGAWASSAKVLSRTEKRRVIVMAGQGDVSRMTVKVRACEDVAAIDRRTLSVVDRRSVA